MAAIMSSCKLVTYLTILVHMGLAGAIRGKSWIPNRDHNKNNNHHHKDNEDLEDALFFNRKEKEIDRSPATTLRYSKGEVVVEKFVETLMASEKYLKMIESVEKKLNHLDASFHERSNSILKYIAEMQRNMKTSPAETLEIALKSVKSDLDKMRQTIMARKDIRPNMRVEGSELHADAALDARLGSMESQVKSIMAGVESIVSIISEVKSRQISRTFPKSEIGTTMDSMSLLNEFRKTVHDQRSRKCECKTGRVDRSERYPTDCHEIHLQGFNVSGIYKIKPDDMEPFYVLCDLTTVGGGWTVFQNRFDGSQDFYKGWSDYKHGFGNLAGEFWLGLEKLNSLTNQKLYELRIEMETHHGQEAYASYSVFTVGPEHEGFRISTLGTYYGSAGDSLSYHAGQKFSTVDTDNDEWKDGACAIEHGGAWWYKECDKSNLNGKYSMTADEHRGQSIYWISFKGPNFPLTKTKMMIRPLPASRPSDFVEQTRKIIESPKLKPILDRQKGIRTKDVKGYDLSHNQPPYRPQNKVQFTPRWQWYGQRN